MATLPFTPTKAQLRVVEEIEQDLQRSQPMMRLIQGDVGSGKTLVALLALVALDNQQQVAIMAPTEILAEQHLHNFSHWLEPFGIKVGWLAGKVKGKNDSSHWHRFNVVKRKWLLARTLYFRSKWSFIR